MSVIPLPELISAYLDGEISPDERRVVEQTLVEDAELRRLYYEFKALQTRLAKLPKYRVPHDLSRAVLRRAEQLWQQQHKAAGHASTDRNPRSWWKIGAWAVGVAAAVLIAVGPWTMQQPRFIARDENRLTPKPNPALQPQPGPMELAKPVTPPAAPPLVKRDVGVISVDKRKDAGKEMRVTGAVATDDAVAPNQLAQGGRALAEQEAAAGVMIVRCDVSAAEVSRQLFTNKLAQHRISWQETAADHDVAKIAEKDRKVDRPTGQADAVAAAPAPTPAGGADRGGGRGGFGPATGTAPEFAAEAILPQRAKGASEPDVDFVYVEATPAQLAALLGEINARPDLFVSTKVLPANTALGERKQYRSDDHFAQRQMSANGQPAAQMFGSARPGDKLDQNMKEDAPAGALPLTTSPSLAESPLAKGNNLVCKAAEKTAGAMNAAGVDDAKARMAEGLAGAPEPAKVPQPEAKPVNTPAIITSPTAPTGSDPAKENQAVTRDESSAARGPAAVDKRASKVASGVAGKPGDKSDATAKSSAESPVRVLFVFRPVHVPAAAAPVAPAAKQ